MPLKLTQHEVGNGLVALEASETMDVYTSPSLRQTLIALSQRSSEEKPIRVVVTLTEIEYMDSTGLGVLLGGLKRLKDQGGDLALVIDNPRILRIFDVTGLYKIFAIYPTQEAALRAWGCELAPAPAATGTGSV